MPLIIKDIPGANGEYEFDFEGTPFTNTELHIIKEVSGVRAGEIGDALAAGDNDLLVAFAEIVLLRNGRPVPRRVLWDAAVGSLVFEFPEVEEVDADVPPPSGSADESATDSRPNGSGSPSGNGSESPENDPSPTGNLPLGTTATFGRATSAT